MTYYKDFFLDFLKALQQMFRDTWYLLRHPRALVRPYVLLWEDICDGVATLFIALLWAAVVGILGLGVFDLVKFLATYATS